MATALSFRMGARLPPRGAGRGVAWPLQRRESGGVALHCTLDVLQDAPITIALSPDTDAEHDYRPAPESLRAMCAWLTGAPRLALLARHRPPGRLLYRAEHIPSPSPCHRCSREDGSGSHPARIAICKPSSRSFPNDSALRATWKGASRVSPFVCDCSCVGIHRPNALMISSPSSSRSISHQYDLPCL